MTYFAIICSAKKFKVNFEVSEVLITYVTNREKVEVMLHIGAGQSNNYQIIGFCFQVSKRGYKVGCELTREEVCWRLPML